MRSPEPCRFRRLVPLWRKMARRCARVFPASCRFRYRKRRAQRTTRSRVRIKAAERVVYSLHLRFDRQAPALRHGVSGIQGKRKTSLQKFIVWRASTVGQASICSSDRFAEIKSRRPSFDYLVVSAFAFRQRASRNCASSSTRLAVAGRRANWLFSTQSFTPSSSLITMNGACFSASCDARNAYSAFQSRSRYPDTIREKFWLAIASRNSRQFRATVGSIANSVACSSSRMRWESTGDSSSTSILIGALRVAVSFAAATLAVFR